MHACMESSHSCFSESSELAYQAPAGRGNLAVSLLVQAPRSRPEACGHSREIAVAYFKEHEIRSLDFVCCSNYACHRCITASPHMSVQPKSCDAVAA